MTRILDEILVCLDMDKTAQCLWNKMTGDAWSNSLEQQISNYTGSQSVTLTNLGRRNMLVGLLMRKLSFYFLMPVTYSGTIRGKRWGGSIIFSWCAHFLIQVTHLFDNGGTVFFAIFMAIWGEYIFTWLVFFYFSFTWPFYMFTWQRRL